jgi:hypothetical protein
MPKARTVFGRMWKCVCCSVCSHISFLKSLYIYIYTHTHTYTYTHTHTQTMEIQTTARGPDAARGTSSCGPFNAAVSNLQLGPFLGYGKSGLMPRAQQFCYHSTYLILWFQSIWFYSALNFLLGRTVVSTTDSKNRKLGPLNISVRYRSVTLRGCVTALWQILIILYVAANLGRQFSNRIAVLCVDTNRQSFHHNMCEIDTVSKFGLYGSAHVKEMFMSVTLWYSFMPNVVDVKVCHCAL